MEKLKNWICVSKFLPHSRLTHSSVIFPLQFFFFKIASFRNPQQIIKCIWRCKLNGKRIWENARKLRTISMKLLRRFAFRENKCSTRTSMSSRHTLNKVEENRIYGNPLRSAVNLSHALRNYPLDAFYAAVSVVLCHFFAFSLQSSSTYACMNGYARKYTDWLCTSCYWIEKWFNDDDKVLSNF